MLKGLQSSGEKREEEGGTGKSNSGGEGVIKMHFRTTMEQQST